MAMLPVTALVPTWAPLTYRRTWAVDRSYTPVRCVHVLVGAVAVENRYCQVTEPPSALGTLERCPACGCRVVATVVGDEAEFCCDACSAVWRLALGRVARVTEQACGEHVEVEGRGPSVGDV